MNISDALDQYRDICSDALKIYTVKLNKSFKTVFIEIHDNTKKDQFYPVGALRNTLRAMFPAKLHEGV